MYVSSWPGLTLREFRPSHSERTLPFPLNAPNRISFCVARSGIYHLFRALHFQQGEIVLVPDYHSGNEVCAIRAAGATIVFYPILRNLEPDLEALSRLARLNPRVIYIIHYLGWPQPMRDIEALCRERGSLLVEDCALSLLSETGHKPLGSFGDYSAFCLYKTLPVPNGGLLVQNHNFLPELKDLKLERCPRATAAGRSAELMLEAARSRSDGIGKALFGVKRVIGQLLRSASVRQVPVGNIGWNIGDVNIAMSPIGNTVMQGLEYGQIRYIRRENFLLLQRRLEGRVTMLRNDLPEGVCPLFFPILVQDKHSAAQALWKRGIGAVEFWNDEVPGAHSAGGPDARYLRAHVLELPIHQYVTRSQVEYIADQVLRLELQPVQ
jgi:dTDP-4-amino-4,6-dideoxygalactose transaminase